MNLAARIDHTALKPTLTMAEVEKMCSEAKEYGFAAVCVPPLFVRAAKGYCEGSAVKVATVIGFPFGYSVIEAKLAEAVMAMVDGADELDVVINLAALKNNDWQYLAKELQTLLSVIQSKGKILKVIIETSELTEKEIIQCCDLYGIAGVDFVKTSTGYASGGATIEVVTLIRKHLADAVKIKASGGIKTATFAEALVKAGADRLGCSSSLAIIGKDIKTDNNY